MARVLVRTTAMEEAMAREAVATVLLEEVASKVDVKAIVLEVAARPVAKAHLMEAWAKAAAARTTVRSDRGAAARVSAKIKVSSVAAKAKAMAAWAAIWGLAPIALGVAVAHPAEWMAIAGEVVALAKAVAWTIAGATRAATTWAKAALEKWAKAPGRLPEAGLAA